ncbi:hypothetical protein BT63DRAFT_479994 [Microthyrium microscopicum]|uniref:Transmembrane protein n=1 Tax=Microthyrium microscopicum TaxID=703497 RepID=A0A6A6UAX9_9PEZI|nr:hypothetical protein BT63DRAFT_479994 [Microthyrium microscopicum]
MSTYTHYSPPRSPSKEQPQRLSNPFSTGPSSPNPIDDADISSIENSQWISYGAGKPRAWPTGNKPENTQRDIKTPARPDSARLSSDDSSNKLSPRPISILPPQPVTPIDPEKAQLALDQSTSYEFHPNDNYHETREDVKAKSLQILVYLSAPVFLISLILALWAVFALFIFLIITPFSIFRRSKRTPRERALILLAPALKLHLSCICATLHSDVFSSYSIPLLVVVLLLAPVISIAVAISAWTAAFFWFFAAIIGDPEGTESESRRSSFLKEEDEDGKASVISVRNWWKRWLMKAMRGDARY